MGGITSSRDALEFFMAGAAAVALGTGLLLDPEAPRNVVSELKDYCIEHGLTSIQEIVGTAWN